MTVPVNKRSCGLLVLAVGWALFLTFVGSPQIMLFTVPVFMLAAPLAMGRYIGDELIGKMQGGQARRRRLRASVSPTFEHVPLRPRRASALIASNLAGRAPPLIPA